MYSIDDGHEMAVSANPSGAALWSLHGRVAAVTGAAQGIGRAIARVLAEAGARVVLADRLAEQLAVTADDLRREGLAVIAAEIDVTRPEDAERLVQTAHDRFGGLDILVNNAGISLRTMVAETDPEAWRRVLDVNLTGVFLCCRAAVPSMIAAGHGKIVNVASGVVERPRAGRSAYIASKAGVRALTEVLALEVAPHNIQVNAIAPGFVPTTLTVGPDALPPDQVPAAVARVPAGRAGTGEDMGRVVLFLASRASDYVTGQMIVVDGGLNI